MGQSKGLFGSLARNAASREATMACTTGAGRCARRGHPFRLSPGSRTRNGCALILVLGHPEPEAGCI
jgi:hypothetical protein